MTAINHSIIGLPRSGKTTFLAALWHLLIAGELPTRLELDRLVGDLQYLNSIVEAWHKCEEVQRTSIAAEASVSIHVREVATGRETALIFPDLSGESFERQIATRSCPKSYIDTLSGHGGVLLFVTADRAQDGMTILDLKPIWEEESEDAQQTQVTEWADQMVPEQVKLVELLQFMQAPPFEIRKRKIAILVSAWDVIEGQYSPAQWVAQELPLLHQFLASNSESFDLRVYGVSAQGGNLKGKQREALVNMTPSDRIACIGLETEPHDLTCPIVWLTAEY